MRGALGPYQWKVLRFLDRAWKDSRGAECSLGRLIDLDNVAYDRRARSRRMNSVMSLEARGLVQSKEVRIPNRAPVVIFGLTKAGRRVAQL